MSGNHNQSLERALEIVEAAAKTGAHALKIQTYTPDTMTLDLDEREFQISDPKSLWAGTSLYKLYGQAYTPWEWHKPIFERARELGLDVIITDHHEPPELLPNAFAILNPKQPGCDFPFKMLAGVGVAFYLLIALRAELRSKNDPRADRLNLRKFLDLVAIGTIADVAPLNGVNHILCRVGLSVMYEHLLNGQRIGISALLRLAGWKMDNGIVDATDVGFKIGPRLNAAGRLGSAMAAAELMMTTDHPRAIELAEFLHGENSARQELEKKAVEQALKMSSASNQDICSVVLCDAAHVFLVWLRFLLLQCVTDQCTAHHHADLASTEMVDECPSRPY
jgi:hypothetical protein